jgi:hypothetical protein
VLLTPATSGPACAFVIERSALAPTGVGPSVDVLLLKAGSVVGELTVALFVADADVPEAIATTSWSGNAAPLANAPFVHVTVVEPEHNQPAVGEETKVKPAGSVSAMVTAEASDGPAFETDRLYVAFVPAVNAPTCVLVIERSAFEVSGPGSVAV